MSTFFPPLRARLNRTRISLLRIAEEVRLTLERRHLPHGTILDPIFTSPESNVVDHYTRGGDSAIWTGHYLAAEAYRFAVTRSPEALESVRSIVRAMRRLIDVTGTNLLSRLWLPADSPWADAIVREERQHRAYEATLDGKPVLWLGNTSRDQYMGAFFGLSVAYEWIDDTGLRAEIADIVTRALDFLLEKGWAVVMPDGESSTVFWQRVDQRLALLQVGRQVNDTRFSSAYRNERFLGSLGVMAPVAFEVAEPHESYFKLNLVAIGMFCLIRGELSDTHRERYVDAYRLFRKTVDDHGNAHFDMINRALEGPDLPRDLRVERLLQAWTRRPRRDFHVDLRGRLAACGEDRACEAIPVEERVNTDFLWQRSPFLLYGGGDGFIESAGVDFLLPYWMGRAYGVL
jgi:hypothetical protein